jgi:hypothetical protein
MEEADSMTRWEDFFKTLFGSEAIYNPGVDTERRLGNVNYVRFMETLQQSISNKIFFFF